MFTTEGGSIFDAFKPEPQVRIYDKPNVAELDELDVFDKKHHKRFRQI
jgi:hypothetical protein